MNPNQYITFILAIILISFYISQIAMALYELISGRIIYKKATMKRQLLDMFFFYFLFIISIFLVIDSVGTLQHIIGIIIALIQGILFIGSGVIVLQNNSVIYDFESDIAVILSFNITCLALFIAFILPVL
jgi:hypothetical protein